VMYYNISMYRNSMTNSVVIERLFVYMVELESV